MVAGERKLEAAADRGAVEGRDPGLAAGLDAPEEQRQLAAFLEETERRLFLALILGERRKCAAKRLKEGQIGTGAERVLGRGDHHAFDGGVGRKPLDVRR